ncbi:hypothetical protein [Chromohalobacter israelensis]|uniref:hypothetical protein n=1 Tax=Chromohalobacter israelensis TaxID=141390 RepID=UPI00265C6FB3|nr:hypothetical protein [Chromohalobacter salexigens]MDO0945916.1 hypothetical protein [Chromohalobacter salexigens]
MLTRKTFALVKIEAEYGVDPGLTVDDILVLTDVSGTRYGGNTTDRTRMRPSLGGFAQINTGPNAQVTLTMPLKGAGTPGDVPECGALLRACGHSETITADDGSGTGNVVYQPVSEDFESVTVYWITDNQVQRITGARGTATLNLTAGSDPTIQVALTGAYTRPEAFELTGEYEETHTEVPVNEQNTSDYSVHGYEGCGQSLTVTQNNTVTWRNLINCVGAHITDRQSTGQVNIEAPDLATKDYFAEIESHQAVRTGAISLTHGTVAGNIFEFNAPAAQLSSLSDQDQDGYVHYQMDARFLPVNGDDEYTLTFR